MLKQTLTRLRKVLGIEQSIGRGSLDEETVLPQSKKLSWETVYQVKFTQRKVRRIATIDAKLELEFLHSVTCVRIGASQSVTRVDRVPNVQMRLSYFRLL